MTIFNVARQVADQFTAEHPSFAVAVAVTTDATGRVEAAVFRLSYSGAVFMLHDLVEKLVTAAKLALPQYQIHVFLQGPGRCAWGIVRTEDASIDIPMVR